MKQFILPSLPDKNGKIRLDEKDFHYLVRVRRFSVGSTFTALSLQSELFNVIIDSIDEKSLTGTCIPINLGKKNTEVQKVPRIILFQALPKGAKMDLIVRQATEGGISEIIPFTSMYSVPHLDADRASSKTQRWERIIKEARQQSGSSQITSIEPLTDVTGIMQYWENLTSRENNLVGILLHQDPLAQGSFHGYLSRDVDVAVLLIGPEGGFSPEEADRFIAAGFKPLIMGNTILRTETAALYAAAAIRIILLEKSSWMLKQPLK